MAVSGESAAAAAAAEAEGPVLGLISKRLRALRKKNNRILQTEESLAQGKSLNKEQEELLRSKPAVTALIDELEKLRSPLAAALQDEFSRRPSPPPQQPSPSAPVAAEPDDKAIEDLLSLLYFGCLFDVRPQNEFTAMMLTRTHERDCCLTYDYVTDDATDLLGERDLDTISALGSLVISRPAYSGVSHKNALQECVQRARLWFQKSNQPIHPGASVTYAGLKEKLNKIMASDYFTATPEMKAPVDVAAAVGKYSTTCQVQISEATTVASPAAQIEGSPAHYQQKEDEQDDFQPTEVQPEHQSSPADEPPKDEADVLNPSSDIASVQQEQQKLEADEKELNQRDPEPKDQQYIPRRGYQNQRGGSRGGGGGGGGRRGYPNGRGGRGRGGGGSYQNGRSQYYDSGYHPRNYNSRGRGGRSGGSAMYNNHGGGPHGDHVPVNAEWGTST
ncbi:uncharacterized protein LOC103720099 isoform X2 [Phoenix dactylifera]|uniref:Uncharacterized protein LOC103720099 isoform X2 n=1 Tax=Phoenix dactylifera TaxID=42345 RepID=A0A8B7CW74_PHODC|nr:uncharacterized protein LOC103720099 isoform X2 [Phoenix dactylifera]